MMEVDNDEDLVYEDLADAKILKEEDDRAVSSTGSLSDTDEEDEYSNKLISFSKEPINSEERIILVPRRSSDFPSSNFGIESPKPVEKVSEDEIQDLYDGLGIDISDSKIRENTIFIQAIKPISVYQAEKIFAEYNPIRCALLSAKSAVLKFKDEYVAAEALIKLTKRLVRTRKESAPEEGEINEEQTDVIVVRKDGSRKRKQMANTIELDVEEVEIPAGNWQVVCKHVPKGCHIFARFAVVSEVRQSMVNPYRQEVTEVDESKESTSDLNDFKGYDKRRVKPGINVFKEDGTELGWNYEHDTRFYEDADAVSTQNKEDEKTVETLSGKVEEIITKSGQKIISRGRGSKKFIAALLDSDSD